MGPGKDEIPAIMFPEFLSAEDANRSFLKPQDRVIGFTSEGIAKAYPVKILNWHEIVNDRVADQYIAITFCPLCGTGMVCDANLPRGKLTFGVSSLLYQSDILLYDHQTKSLWSQIMSEAVTGPLTGTHLTLLPSTQTTWQKWQNKYPQTLVLSDQTGFKRDYSRDPYEGYDKIPRLMFNVDESSNRQQPFKMRPVKNYPR